MTQLVPSIDILDGQMVRLRHGDFEQKTTYEASPVEVARRFAEAGARDLHVVDLDGAREGKVRHWDVVQSLVKLGLDVQLGGGLQADADVTMAFEQGVARIVVGSLALREPGRVRRSSSGFRRSFCQSCRPRDGLLIETR